MLNDFGESKVTIKKDELLTSIKQNRNAHWAMYLVAKEGYRAEVIRCLEKTLGEVKEEKPIILERITGLVRPTEHTKDYDRVIRMLEMCIADEITVTELQFSQYVLDDWTWKNQFVTSNARYSK